MSRRKIFELFGTIVIEGTAANKAALTQLQKDIRATNQRLNKMGRDAKKVGLAITKNLTLPLLALATASVKVGADFDKAMTNSLAIMDDVSDSMCEKMGDTARQVAKDYNIAADSVAEAYFFLASAGLDAEKSMAALANVAAFAKAGNFDLAKATDLLTDTQSALGLASEDTATHMHNMVLVSDMLIEANKNANASAEQFSEALTNRAGVAMKDFNKDLSEGLSVLQVLADKGFAKGLKAGEKFDSLLTSLSNSAVTNAQAFKDANISIFDADGNMRHMAQIVDDLTGRFGSMSDQQKTAELQMLGLTENAASTAKALFGTSDAIREYEESLLSAGGATEEVAQKQLESFWEQVGLARRGIEDLGIELSERLLPILKNHIIPAIEKLTKAIQTMFEWFEDHPALRDFVESFVIALATMGPLLLLFVKFIPLIKTVIGLYQILTASQITLNAVMATNPIGLIITAIALLIAAGVALYKNWDIVKEKGSLLWDSTLRVWVKSIDFLTVKIKEFALLYIKEWQKLGRFIPGVASDLDQLIVRMEASLELTKQEANARELARVEWAKSIVLAKEAAEIAEEVAAARIIAIEEEAAAAELAAAAAEVLSLEQIEAARVLAEKRSEFEGKWTSELFKQSSTRMEILENEHALALAEAESLGADKEAVDLFYQNKKIELERKTAKQQLDISRQLAKEQAGLMDDDLARLRVVTDQKIIENEMEKNEAVRIANERGLDTSDLVALYRAREQRIIAEAAVQEIKISDKVKAERIKDVRSVFQKVGSFVGQINTIWKDSLDKRTTEIDNETEQRREAIENSLLSEEDKAEALSLIDAESNAKKKALQKENAIREKAAALFGIALNTALGVSAALATANIPLSIVIGALGLVELGVAAATPLPLAEGALIRSDPGRGVLAQVGEGKQDEIVLPMKTGALELANNIFGKMQSLGSPQSQQKVVKEVHNHFHVGTLIANDFGVKKLAKEVNKYIVSDNQRTGVA